MQTLLTQPLTKTRKEFILKLIPQATIDKRLLKSPSALPHICTTSHFVGVAFLSLLALLLRAPQESEESQFKSWFGRVLAG